MNHAGDLEVVQLQQIVDIRANFDGDAGEVIARANDVCRSWRSQRCAVDNAQREDRHR